MFGSDPLNGMDCDEEADPLATDSESESDSDSADECDLSCHYLYKQTYLHCHPCISDSVYMCKLSINQ